MKYFIKSQDSSAIIGPYSIEEIEARLKTGELSGNALARADTGESPAQATGWLCVHQLPGVGGNPPMRGLGAPQLPISANYSEKASGAAAAGESFCRKCSKRLAPGETVCPECVESLTPSAKQPARPHPLRVIFLHVPGGALVHFMSFLFVCGILGSALFRAHMGSLILLALIHCVVWIAIAFRMIRNPANQGVAFGILIGVCFTGLFTGNCALSK